MLATRISVFPLIYQLLSLSVGVARQSESSDSSNTLMPMEEDYVSSILIVLMTDTILVPVDTTTAVVVVPSLSNAAQTTELATLSMSSSLLMVSTPILLTTRATVTSMDTDTVAVTSTNTVGVKSSDRSGDGILAAIVACTVVLVIAATAVFIAISTFYIRHRKARSYLLGALPNSESNASIVYMNAITTASEPSNDSKIMSKEGKTLNHYAASPSSDHIYEMTEVTGESTKVQAADDVSNCESKHRRSLSSRSWGGSSKRRISHYENMPVARRYNSVGDYEIMMPQLQAAAAKKQKVPLNAVDIYSEIANNEDSEDAQQSDIYVTMQPEDTSKQSTLPPTERPGKQEDSTASQTNNTTDQQTLSQVSEEDIYIEML